MGQTKNSKSNKFFPQRWLKKENKIWANQQNSADNMFSIERVLFPIVSDAMWTGGRNKTCVHLCPVESWYLYRPVRITFSLHNNRKIPAEVVWNLTFFNFYILEPNYKQRRFCNRHLKGKWISKKVSDRFRDCTGRSGGIALRGVNNQQQIKGLRSGRSSSISLRQKPHSAKVKMACDSTAERINE